jgi:hypothetical protein
MADARKHTSGGWQRQLCGGVATIHSRATQDGGNNTTEIAKSLGSAAVPLSRQRHPATGYFSGSVTLGENLATANLQSSATVGL